MKTFAPSCFLLFSTIYTTIPVARENGYQEILSKRGERNARAAIRKRQRADKECMTDDGMNADDDIENESAHLPSESSKDKMS